MAGENEKFIRRWYDEVWCKGREEAITEMFAEDATAHGIVDDEGNALNGVDAFIAYHRKLRGAFPNLEVIVEDVICEGDKVVARCRVRGLHTGDTLGFAATGKPIDITGISIGRVKDGKLIEGWNNFDFMSLYQQIDAL